MSHIKEILQKNLRKAGIEKAVGAAQIVDALQVLLNKEFPENIAKRMEVRSLKNYAITVHVDSSAVGQELKMHERQLLKKLSHKFPSVRIDRIRFSF